MKALAGAVVVFAAAVLLAGGVLADAIYQGLARNYATFTFPAYIGAVVLGVIGLAVFFLGLLSPGDTPRGGQAVPRNHSAPDGPGRT